MSTDNFCFYLQNRLIQTSQTGGQRYSDTSPFSIPCIHLKPFSIANLETIWFEFSRETEAKHWKREFLGMDPLYVIFFIYCSVSKAKKRMSAANSQRPRIYLSCSCCYPWACTIKLFNVVIYRFLWKACPWQAFPEAVFLVMCDPSMNNLWAN